MQNNENNEDGVQSFTFAELTNPQLNDITYDSIQYGFANKDWKCQYQTITHLRQANRFYDVIFMQQLLPKVYKNIVQQVDNLRSNNAREALTLVAQIVQHQNLSNAKEEIIKCFMDALFSKSVSQKGFLKSEALKALNTIPTKSNPYLVYSINSHTDSNNGTISQLAIKLLKEYMDNNQVSEVDDQFLRRLSKNINGKRAVVQKRSKEILEGLKKRKGQKELQVIIDKSQELNEEESQTLKRQLKNSTLQKSKPQASFKDFMKMKKDQAENQLNQG